MTRKELREFAVENRLQIDRVVVGYTSYSNAPAELKEGCIKLGSNSGVYGWNWTAYFNAEKRILFVDSYRGTPDFTKLGFIVSHKA